MKRKAGLLTEEEEEENYLEILDDDGDDDPEIRNTAENLKVFCVSAVEYLKLTKKLPKDGPPLVSTKIFSYAFEIVSLLCNSIWSLHVYMLGN